MMIDKKPAKTTRQQNLKKLLQRLSKPLSQEQLESVVGGLQEKPQIEIPD